MDALRAELAGQRLCQRPQPKLAYRQTCKPGAAAQGSCRARQQDGSTSARDHGWQDLLGAEKPAKAVGLPTLLELLGGHFEDATQLEGARVVNKDLRGAQLQGAILTRAEMRNVFLDDAELENADLSYASLQGSHLLGAQLHGAVLDHADAGGGDRDQRSAATRFNVRDDRLRHQEHTGQVDVQT